MIDSDNDSTNSNDEFYKCISNIECEIVKNYNSYEIKRQKSLEKEERRKMKKEGGGGKHHKEERKEKERVVLEGSTGNTAIDTCNTVIDTGNPTIDPIEANPNNPTDDNVDILSRIDSLKDIKVGQLKHNGEVIDVYLDRNKKKYVNYKGNRVYT